LRPLKTKELFPKIAEDTNCTEDEVRAVADFFWSEVRQSLSELSDIRIHLVNLGDFTIKHWLIDKEVERCRNIITNRSQLSTPLQARIDQLLGAKEIHMEEVQRKEFIYNHKKLSNENKSRKSS
jgi:nucleoid DNA-binding protein